MLFVNHEIEVSNLAFNKISSDPVNFKKYDINIDLEEESSNEQQTMLKYSLDLASNPKNSVISISGNAILTGTQTEIENYLKQDGENVPSIVSSIYRELFPLMYIISKDMKIPSPAHTISQNNVVDEPMNSETMSENKSDDSTQESSKVSTDADSNIEKDTPVTNADEKDTPVTNADEKDTTDDVNEDTS